MLYTIEEIKRIDFLHATMVRLNETFSLGETCKEAELMRIYIPKDIGSQWENMTNHVLEKAQDMSLKELTNLLSQLPPGYLKYKISVVHLRKETNEVRY